MNQLLLNFTSQTIKLLCRPEYRKFQADLNQPEIAQQRVLASILKKLARTQYGKQFGITGKETYLQFAAKLPICSYEEIAPWISKQLQFPGKNILVNNVVHVETTSGSSGSAKSIPYTRDMINCFSNMFCIWAYNLLAYGFKPTTGKIFFSISPSKSGIGFTDDREYLPHPLRLLLAPFLVLQNNADLPFMDSLALQLLLESRLEVISVWSPSYLLAILSYIQDHKHRLMKLLPSDRAEVIAPDSINWQSVWPCLKLISCWDSWQSQVLAAKLKHLFPDVMLQGKGLLATEAPITIPFVNAGGAVPLVNQIFLEFEEEDGSIRLVHELQPGKQYQVILTQTAGLTRYRLNDVVEVTGSYQSTPILSFAGRANRICDLVGEKLNEIFVAVTLRPLVSDGRFLLIPQQQGYLLLTDKYISQLEEKADSALCNAYRYKEARMIGQLSPVRALIVSDLATKLLLFYESQGMKLGDIKEMSLVTDTAIAQRLLAFLTDDQYKTSPLGQPAAAQSIFQSPVG